nr:MAG TPA: hypothetical protein [Inoviridae sp.]
MKNDLVKTCSKIRFSDKIPLFIGFRQPENNGIKEFS